MGIKRLADWLRPNMPVKRHHDMTAIVFDLTKLSMPPWNHHRKLSQSSDPSSNIMDLRHIYDIN